MRLNPEWQPWDETHGSDLIDVDPRFIAASTDPIAADFSLLAGSPAVNVCPDGPAIDFLGNPRPAGAVDMGALETH